MRAVMEGAVSFAHLCKRAEPLPDRPLLPWVLYTNRLLQVSEVARISQVQLVALIVRDDPREDRVLSNIYIISSNTEMTYRLVEYCDVADGGIKSKEKHFLFLTSLKASKPFEI